MKFSWRTEWPLLIVLAVMFAFAAFSWNAVPDRIPVHWNLGGHPDRWGGRFEGLLLVPLIATVVYVILLVAPRLDPARANYRSFAGAYTALRVLTLLAMLAVQVVIVSIARGRSVDVAVVIPLIVGALFAGIGSLLGRVRPNWFIGIRTPWTLSSAQSWERTHYVAATVFIVSGMLVMSTALMREAWYFIAVVLAIAVAVLGLVIYSYTVWKQDPHKKQL
jgi:uncharacterized membrane protein